MAENAKLTNDGLQAKLLELPLFGKLGAKVVDSLVAYHRFVVCEAGRTLINQGEYTSECCVIVEGLVSAYRSEPGSDEVARIGTLGPGDWFGEMSALSHQPAMATVKADTRCVLIAIDPPLFKDLYKGRNPFKQMVDEKYRERALAAHLRSVPVFKGVPEAKLNQLQEGAEFLVIEKEGEVVAKEGAVADGIYLIRSGSMKVVTTGERGELKGRILSYLMDNSSFGEQALAHRDIDHTWHGDHVTMTRCDIVKLPLDVVEKTFEDDPDTLEYLHTTADLIVAEESGEVTGVYDSLDDAKSVDQLRKDRLEILVEKQSIKGGEALVIDLKKCTRCNLCVESCVAVHEDRVPRLSKKGNRISADQVLSSACYHCGVPSCMSACNDGAIRRDTMGSIHFVYDNCTGCSACVQKCPYEVIRMTPAPGEAPPYIGRSLLETVPFLGPILTQKKEAAALASHEAQEKAAPTVSARTGKAVKAKAIKCDLCAGLPFEACVYNCPCSAISRIHPESLFQMEGAPL